MAEILPWIMIATGLAVIILHFNVWRLLDEQKRHNQATEKLLTEIRDRTH